jgi:hypothetical protein
MALTKIRQEQGVVINEGSTDVDFRVESNGNANMLFVDGGNDKVGIGTSAFVDTSKVQIEGAKALTSGILQGQLNISDSTAVATGAGGGISFSGNYNGTSKTTFGSIEGSKDNGTSGHYGASLVFKTRSNGGANAENMRIDSSGTLLVGKTSDTFATVGTSIFDHGEVQVTRAGSVPLYLRRNTNSGTILEFRKDATAVGTISVDSDSTAYNTSSDYRLKENVDYTWDATTRLKQLKPARFNFIADDTNTLVDGFIAHEVSSIVPEAITGAKDAVDADNNPEYQGIDQSKLVPLLVKTIQELEARITALE